MLLEEKEMLFTSAIVLPSLRFKSSIVPLSSRWFCTCNFLLLGHSLHVIMSPLYKQCARIIIFLDIPFIIWKHLFIGRVTISYWTLFAAWSVNHIPKPILTLSGQRMSLSLRSSLTGMFLLMRRVMLEHVL